MHDLINVVARLHLIDAEAFFGFGAGPDADDSDKLIANAAQVAPVSIVIIISRRIRTRSRSARNI